MDELTNNAAGLVPRPSSAFVASRAWEGATAFVSGSDAAGVKDGNNLLHT